LRAKGLDKSRGLKRVENGSDGRAVARAWLMGDAEGSHAKQMGHGDVARCRAPR